MTPATDPIAAKSDSALPIRIAAMYRFAPFADPVAIRQALEKTCDTHGIKGTLLIAAEGLNGTIAGTDSAIDAVLAHVRSLPGCAAVDVKESRGAAMPFDRLKVRVKPEIVTMGQPDIDPLADVGHYVDPADWNALIDDPGTIVIDTRNDYEVALGSFAGAVDPRTRTFREFPAWFRAYRAEREADGPMPRVAMFCTGGIRCEKATAFLKAEGLDDVHHLKGGILAYLEATPAADSRWQGECFVFDRRITVTADLRPGDRTLCPRCQQALGEDGCPTCNR